MNPDRSKPTLEDYLKLLLASAASNAEVSEPPETYPFSAELSKAIAHIGYGLYEFKSLQVKDYEFQSPATEFNIGSGYVLLPLKPKINNFLDFYNYKRKTETPILEMGNRNFSIEGVYFDTNNAIILPKVMHTEDRSLPNRPINYAGCKIPYVHRVTGDERNLIDTFWSELILIDAPKN
jgi:hypothetical protein